ncbi:hypothetical protein Tco_1083609 [Tanacetum coccineum]
MALYHALMKYILEDEDAIDKGVADRLKKRKPYDADRDEDPLTGPDHGGTTQDPQPKINCKSDYQAIGDIVFEAGILKCHKDLREDKWVNTDETPVVKADP